MDIEIRHLRLVDAIALEGSVTRAAGKLYLTQSALSHQLREIEGRLGTPLFLRLNKKMVLTQAGQQFLSTAKSVLKQIEESESRIRKLAAGNAGLIRISTQCNTCYHWLPSLLQSFRLNHPEVEVEICVEATSNPLQALVEGDLDLALVYKTDPDKRVTYRFLFEDELIVIMHPDHPLASKPFISARDFESETLLVYTRPREENLVFQKILQPAGIAPKKTTQVMLTEAIIEMVKAGVGISVLARWFADSYIASGQVAGVPLTRRGLKRKWSAAIIRNSQTPAHLIDFIELIAKYGLPAAKLGKKMNRHSVKNAGSNDYRNSGRTGLKI